MNSFNRYNCLMLIFILMALACDKDATNYLSYLKNKEVIYPGLIKNTSAAPGNYRVKLSWQPSPDPSITSYRIFWNNRADSVEVAATTTNPADTLSAVISQLEEYTYSFTIFSYDAQGNRSIPEVINNVNIYGDNYRNSLTNRFLNADNPYTLDGSSITLHFEEPDTINLNTEVSYTKGSGQLSTLHLGPETSDITLPDYKAGSKVYFRSAYIPVRNAIDTFYTVGPDSLTNVIVPLDKSLFKALHLPNDVNYYDSGTGLENMWDGNTAPTDYPDIFHSGSDIPLPNHLTFDLGKVYPSLAQFEIIGRTCCNNPVHFEIWGIENLTDANFTQLPSNDPGWTDESIAKGWTLLKDVNRADDGVAPYKVPFADGVPPVRYIRIRVISVASGDPNFSNISEVSFWSR